MLNKPLRVRCVCSLYVDPVLEATHAPSLIPLVPPNQYASSSLHYRYHIAEVFFFSFRLLMSLALQFIIGRVMLLVLQHMCECAHAFSFEFNVLTYYNLSINSRQLIRETLNKTVLIYPVE